MDGVKCVLLAFDSADEFQEEIMQYISQIAIIFSISFAGEMLNRLLPLPIPGSIYGLVIMLICLMLGIVKLDKIKAVSDWFISLMPIMFVGPIVGLMDTFDSYKDYIIPLFVISIVTTIITMSVTGLTSQGLMRVQQKRGKKHAE